MESLWSDFNYYFVSIFYSILFKLQVFSLFCPLWLRFHSFFLFFNIYSNCDFISIFSITAICLDPQEAIFSSPVLSEFRILKICSLSLSLRRTWSIYWQSLVKMRDLLLFIFFTIFVISVMCLQLYMGILTQKCVKLPVGAKSDEVWSNFTSNSGKLRITLQFYWFRHISFRLFGCHFVLFYIFFQSFICLRNIDS